MTMAGASHSTAYSLRDSGAVQSTRVGARGWSECPRPMLGTSTVPASPDTLLNFLRAQVSPTPSSLHLDRPYCSVRARSGSDAVSRASLCPSWQERAGRNLHAARHATRECRGSGTRRQLTVGRHEPPGALSVLRSGRRRAWRAYGTLDSAICANGWRRAACAVPSRSADPVRMGRCATARASQLLLTLR